VRAACLAFLAALALHGSVPAQPPLTTAVGWEVLQFRGVPPNRVTATPDGLTIEVHRSAGPVVWPLPQPLAVTRVVASGRIRGAIATTARLQGEPGADDFALRVGLVEAGSRRPTLWQRRFAPAWVQRLFALAPPGQGIAQVRFFNVGLDPSQIGWRRRHPASDLLVEQVVTAPDAEGRFSLSVEVEAVTALGVWLSADGDDTGSRFDVRLEELRLEPAAAP
jgi:hypothetical protein